MTIEDNKKLNASGVMGTRNFGGVDVFDWTGSVEIDEQTEGQISRVSRLPFVRHVAVMPDAHFGMGATIGTVIGTVGAVVPAAVGVDIGCGISAFYTGLVREQIEGHEELIYGMLKNAIPNGRTNNGAKGDRGAWGSTEARVYQRMVEPISVSYAFTMGAVEHWADRLNCKHPFVKEHFGTLGTGNHFVEICVDDMDCVWILVHSGSRGPGAKFAMHFMKRSKQMMKDYFVPLEDDDLAFIPESSSDYADYIRVVETMTEYAKLNRFSMMWQAVQVLKSVTQEMPEELLLSKTFVDTPHNFLRKERLLGKEMMITRKGASTARRGEMVVIPGSMGTGSFIVTGKGNPLSLNSSSHGAGRKMSRTQARKSITLEDHEKATQGIFCDKTDAVIDESPAAYKDINSVIAQQSDLVDIEHRLRAIINMKGA